MSLPDLFPAPTTSPLIPSSHPGASPESTKVLRELLKDNHEKYSAYFNEAGFHNHISHHLVALWSFGAPGEILKSSYKLDSEYQLPVTQSPEEISAENFTLHLGDRKFYDAYLKFFTKKIQDKGVLPTVEEFIFRPEQNFDGKKDPQMLNRFYGGLVHPLIHLGYGIEFNIPGLAAEGLAMAATHEPDSGSNLVPASIFAQQQANGDTATSLAAKIGSALHLGGTTPTRPASNGVHAFKILARMLKDNTLIGLNYPEKNIYSFCVAALDTTIAKYAQDWITGTPTHEEIQGKIEEVVWMNALIYSVAGWTHKADTTFNADFFLMHLVTSSIFIPTYVAHLPLASQVTFLRGYFNISLAWWVSRGRPDLDIEGFFNASSTSHPKHAGPHPTPPKWSLPSDSSELATNPNPWTHIIQRAITHPDDHLIKLQRSFVHFARVFGTRPAGLPDFKDTGLPGAEKIDGSLFIRAAGLTIERLSRDPKETTFWDRHGFFRK